MTNTLIPASAIVEYEGELVHVKEHRRKAPERKRVVQIQEALCAMDNREETLIWNVARCLAKLEMLESRIG